MRVAVLSDVHGFSLSLQAVLDDIDAHGPWDAIAVAGDLAEGGPDPAAAVDLIRDRGLLVVQGNTDRDLAADARIGQGPGWTRDRLGHERLAWLDQLPFDVRISPPESSGPDANLLIVHANPSDMDSHLAPDAPESSVRDLIDGARAAAIAFGHIHVSYIRTVDDILLVDVSAAGNPKDGDIRSRWGSFEWDGTVWSAGIHYVDVDTAAVVAQFRQSGRPNPEKAIAKYLRASYAN